MIHLVGNAHLDPAWMWPLEEGFEAFAATCRSALDRIAEYPDLIFTCSSAAHYEYVEQTDPALFERIKRAVANGSWCIVGGWWVEADCNLPSGESLIRQALLGQGYFESRFGRIATVGYNIDSFGHNANVPALLSGAGLTSYVFMRPEQHEAQLTDALFDWRSPSGSAVKTYRLPLHYSNHQHDVSAKLDLLPQYPLYRPDQDWMIFFGVGNHGGGPTIEQLQQIRQEQRKRQDIHLSDPAKFFASVRPHQTLSGEMNPHAIGAYSANALIKKLNRLAEYALDRAERMQVMRSLVVPGFKNESLTEPWKNVCLTQFHDLLGGVSTVEASQETIELQQEAIATAKRSARLDRQRIASCIDTSRAIQNIIVFNDSAYDRTECVEFELWHPHASEKGDVLRDVVLEDSAGVRIACQKIQPSGKIGEDRVRWLARVTVPSFGWKSFAVHEHERANSTASIADHPLKVRLLVTSDSGDTWAHGVSTYLPAQESFRAVRREAFENGPLRSGERVLLEYKNSRAEIEYLRYADEDFVELRVFLDWHEPDATVLLAVPHGIPGATVRYGIPYAYIDRPADGKEYPGQTWLDARDVTGAGLALLNDAKYSFSADAENVYVTLARSKSYAYHVPPHELSEHERLRHLDHGVQECRFVALPHDAPLTVGYLSRLSDRLNAPLAVHHESQHSGDLPATGSYLKCENPGVRIGTVKPAEDSAGTVLRLVELEGKEQKVKISSAVATFDASIPPFSIQSYRVLGDEAAKVDFLERPQ